MILVTGAAGKTGVAVTRELARGLKVRALVRRPDQIAVPKQLGASEVLVGDLRSFSALDQACRDAHGIYHICPNMHPEELRISQAAIQAAQVQGLEHFVYHSVLHPQTEAMPHHWNKLRVEEMLFESDLSFTILQPASYMQNLLNYWTQIVKEGIYAIPYSGQTRLSLVDLKDVAEAAATVVVTPGHQRATYELCGPHVLSQESMVEILGRELGRSVRVEVVPLEEWEQSARSSGMGDYQVQTLSKMFHYYDRNGLWGSPRVLEWLLARPPSTLAHFVRRTLTE